MENRCNKLEEEGIEMRNLRCVMNILAFRKREVTEDELLTYFVTSTYQPHNHVQKELKRILDNGVINGFIVKRDNKYKVPSLENLYSADSDKPCTHVNVKTERKSEVYDETTRRSGTPSTGGRRSAKRRRYTRGRKSTIGRLFRPEDCKGERDEAIGFEYDGCREPAEGDVVIASDEEDEACATEEEDDDVALGTSDAGTTEERRASITTVSLVIYGKRHRTATTCSLPLCLKKDETEEIHDDIAPTVGDEACETEEIDDDIVPVGRDETCATEEEDDDVTLGASDAGTTEERRASTPTLSLVIYGKRHRIATKCSLPLCLKKDETEEIHDDIATAVGDEACETEEIDDDIVPVGRDETCATEEEDDDVALGASDAGTTEERRTSKRDKKAKSCSCSK